MPGDSANTGREMSAFLDALRSGRVLLMDGAMGTELRRAGLADNGCGELWNGARVGFRYALTGSYDASARLCRQDDHLRVDRGL